MLIGSKIWKIMRNTITGTEARNFIRKLEKNISANAVE